MDRSLFFRLSFLLIFSTLSFIDSAAQTPSPYTTIDYVKFVKFQATDGNYNGDYRWRFYSSTASGAAYTCVKQYGDAAHSYTFSTVIPITSTYKSINDDNSMSVEAWQEDSYYECNRYSNCGMGDCDYNHGCGCEDNWHCDQSNGDRTFKLADYEPGLENTVTINYCSNQITYAFRYKPTAPVVSGVTYGTTGTENVYKSGNMCANNTIKVAVATAMNSSYNGILEYVWEYNIGGEQEQYWIPNPDYCGNDAICSGGTGPQPASHAQKSSGAASPMLAAPGTTPPPCCYVSPGSWGTQTKWTALTSTYGKTDNGTLTLDLLSLSKIANLTSNSYIQLRVTTVAHGISSSNQGSISISLSPRAPVLGLVEEVQSCPNATTGSIKVSGIKGSGKYQYTIRPGHDNNQPCTPVVGCLNGIKSGDITGSSAEITPVPGGEYTLWISNYGGTYGVCSSTENVTIPIIAVLSIKDAEPKQDATCNGYADGVVKITYSGGVAPYTYSLTNNASNTTGIFSGLKADTYTASVTDGCSQVNANTTEQISIAEPKSIKAGVVGSTLTCNSPADGVIVTTISDGPGTYNYYLKQSGTTLVKVENTSIVSWNVSNRIAGSYVVEILDAQRTACPGFSSPVTLTAPPTLAIDAGNFQVTNVSCNDGSDGKVTLVNLDMTGKYNYTLTRSDNTTYTTSTASDIAGLRGADYRLSVMRNIPGCTDKYAYPSAITVTQPSPITIGLTKQDISCFGLTDGKVISSVSGGTGPNYSYTWEQSIGSSWSTLSSTASSVSGRSQGIFRVRVKDTRNCPAVSDQVTITEPSKLTITSAAVQDIKCFGEKGYITMNAQGGTGTAVYQYSLGGSSFTTFNASTPLGAGSYTVRAVDGNNCITQYGSALPITTPASALNFTFTKSDYNGVNISCFGGSNGYITLTPSGGNGGSFSGYTYAIDTNPYQSIEKLESINAGNHTLYVKDGRGCTKSQVINFTESMDKLSLSLVSKKDVACFGDQTGELQVTGSGGISPYNYNVDAGINQSLGKFTALGAGTHTIKLTDKNNCTNSADFEILSLNPVIQINASVSDVKCFNGSDGKITLSISGGVSPFTFAWAGQSSGTSELTNLTSGNYSVTVTDNAGCKMDQTIGVSQPAQALKISVATVPVCYGMTNGVITIHSTGGTAPYFYSIDDGNIYQANEVFNTVSVGSYAIRVKDMNDCFTTSSATIIQRNDKPEPDFIVATTESALDTLVITEISVPKPDSIEWIFDAHAIILDNNTWQPKIKFENEGIYSQGMKGYFGGCDYTVTRNLTIKAYDPESSKTKLPDYKAISSVDLTPNPNAGQFAVTVKLNYKHNLTMIVYDIVGGTHYRNTWDNVEEVTQTITLDNVASGVYLLRVITPQDARDIRMVINK